VRFTKTHERKGRDMKRITSMLIFGLLLVALAAATVASAGAGNDKPRPYKNSGTGGQLVPADPNFCNPIPGLQFCFKTASEGHASHLGKITETSEGIGTILVGNGFGGLCLLRDGSTLGLEIHNVGTGTAVAANGDELYLTFENTICFDFSTPPTGVAGDITGSQVITGGTGRFEGASGSTTTVGISTFDGFSLVATGTIAY
jgi:hypothetical protein